MEHVKLRLDYSEINGVKLAVGDTIECNMIKMVIVPDDSAVNCKVKDRIITLFSANAIFHNMVFITSFALRKNTGSQPVGDDVPVVVEWADGDFDNCIGNTFLWHNNTDIESSIIQSWKPNINKLIKMQIEHDAKNNKVTHPYHNAILVKSHTQEEKEMSKFNKDLTKVPYNRILLLEWLYAGVVGDAMHCMGYKEKGDGRS